jgi:PadR family transcriptional regulator, regulatory protein PadR
MRRKRRPSVQTTAVVRALAQEPSAWRYGYELCRQLGIKAGSMYPILMRLADRGLLDTTWETNPEPGRPPRHLYRLTGPGLALAAELVEEDATAARAAAPDSAPARRIGGTPRLAGRQT